MSFDLDQLRAAIDAHGPVRRVVVAAVEGSAPREAGAAMLVWDGGQSGTIGGGALEFEAVRTARQGDFLRRIPLGPAIGQCCGGVVTLAAETWDLENLDWIEGHVLRRLSGEAEQPLIISKALTTYRNSGVTVPVMFEKGWFLEPVTRATCEVWIYGAGHVGRALVGVLSPLPELAITWVDTDASRFPPDMPDQVTKLVAARPGDVVAYAPGHADHLILTYSHALDLEICHRLLNHKFGSAGLIGSKTKWARFRKRLCALGHSPEQVDRIHCPIGDPSLGKHPQLIALGVATRLLSGGVRVTRTLGETA